MFIIKMTQAEYDGFWETMKSRRFVASDFPDGELPTEAQIVIVETPITERLEE